MGLILVLLGLFSYSQSQAKDIIYQADQGEIIINCTITQITEGNLVFYKLREKAYQKRALAVKRAGVYIDLSEFVTQLPDSKQKAEALEEETISKTDTVVSLDSHDSIGYYHYQLLYKSAVNKRTAGLIFSSLGVVLSATSYLIAKESKNPRSILQGVFLFGFFSFILGIPTLIANNIKTNKNTEPI